MLRVLIPFVLRLPKDERTHTLLGGRYYSSVVRRSLAILFVCCFLALLIQSLSAQVPPSHATFTSYAQARAVLAALTDILPPELKEQQEARREAAWTTWVVRHDREIRDRLERGDEDTVVNWLLFGTSFTHRPRALIDTGTADQGTLGQLIAGRTADLVAALASPAGDDRRMFVRRLFERQGYRFATPLDRSRLESHLISLVARVAAEQGKFASELAAARNAADATQEFAARSKLFRERGLSLDTSMLPNLAIERALDAMRARGLLAPHSVRRVAVIGPGLDFADKDSGYDFYPQQTVQPFAVIDALVRLGLSRTATDIDVTTLDVSRRVNDHLHAVRRRAEAGSPTMLRFPFDRGLPWTPEVVAYWREVGKRIGVDVMTARSPAIGKQLEVRAVQVRPEIVARVSANDFNIVAERWTGPPFDLVVATNVLVYYDTLDQCLAFGNIEAMLRPGGFLLSNNAVLELPGSRMHSDGYVTTRYSDRPDEGDHIVWYKRER